MPGVIGKDVFGAITGVSPGIKNHENISVDGG